MIGEPSAVAVGVFSGEVFPGGDFSWRDIFHEKVFSGVGVFFRGVFSTGVIIWEGIF